MLSLENFRSSLDGVYASIAPIPTDHFAMKCEGDDMETSFTCPQSPPEGKGRYAVPRPSTQQVGASLPRNEPNQ